MSKYHFRASGLALCAALLASSSVFAEDAEMKANLRGTVVNYSGTTLSVKSREGSIVEVDLAEGWQITSLAQASLADIKTGDYVGVASLPKAGGEKALEVLIFPPALKGAGEGSHGWDLTPHSRMTNASVSNQVEGVNGQTVTLSYKGGHKTVTIPTDAPVVTFAPATPDDLKPGAAVFVPKVGGGAKVTAHQVVVGKDGVVPPM